MCDRVRFLDTLIVPLADNLAAAEVKLTTDELAALDKVSALPSEYPGWMLQRQGAERLPFA